MVRQLYGINKSKFKTIYAILAIVFFIYAIFCFNSMQMQAQASDEWSIPSSRPAGASSSSGICEVTTVEGLLYALNRSSITEIDILSFIDASNHTWPVFNISRGLTINGNNHTISGLKINTSLNVYVGFIASTSKKLVVNNLNLIIDFKTTKNKDVGGIIANTSNELSIQGCKVSGQIKATTSAATDYSVGGLVGYSKNKITIANSYNYATITSTNSSTANTKTGGIAGYLESTTTKNISQCANHGAVKASRSYVGGIVGDYSGSSSIQLCYNIGKIESTSGTAGGIAGMAYQSNSFINCFNNANIKGGNAAGGIVGDNGGTNCTTTFTSCYNSGVLNSPYKNALEKKSYTYSSSSSTGRIAKYKVGSYDLIIYVSQLEVATGRYYPMLMGSPNRKTKETKSITYNDIGYPSYNVITADVKYVRGGTKVNLGTISLNTANTIVNNTNYKTFDAGVTGKNGKDRYITFTMQYSNIYYVQLDQGFGLETNDSNTNKAMAEIYDHDLWPYHCVYDYTASSLQLYWIKCEKQDKFELYPEVLLTAPKTDTSGTHGYYSVMCRDYNQGFSCEIPGGMGLPNHIYFNKDAIRYTEIDSFKKADCLAILGSAYAIDAKINNGYPFLKCMYWGY